MKKIVLAGIASLLITAGVAVAQQSQDQNDGSSMRGMMHQMMKDQGNPGAAMGHVGGMMNMMNMMSQMDPEQMSKMMERCGAMMESTRTDAEKESQKQ